jgi:hypothetical protein
MHGTRRFDPKHNIAVLKVLESDVDSAAVPLLKLPQPYLFTCTVSVFMHFMFSPGDVGSGDPEWTPPHRHTHS